MILLCLCLAPTLWAAAPKPFLSPAKNSLLPPEQAFELSLGKVSDQAVVLEFAIAPGTYLYQKAFAFTADQARLGKPVYPAGELIHDPYFGEVTVYRQHAEITLPITTAQARHFQLEAAYQGCNDQGFCYPPQTAKFEITLQSGPLNPSDRALHLLQDAPLGWALAAFFGFGLLLAFSPCILPMVPILSALIIGEQHRHHRGHAFRLALTYVLAMATAYAFLGASLASLGSHVQAQLQHPAVLSFTAAILILMAVLLFNDKALAFASRINHPLHQLSHKLHAGKTWGVAAMGFLSALIISPCVTPPLIGALTYIALSGNVALGAAALFLLAMGMGVPLLAVAWGGTALLPSRGPWLHYVKHAFAIVLVLMALSLLTRFLAPNWDWRRPLAGLETPSSQHQASLPFIQVRSVEALNEALKEAASRGQPVMLDFYADWCSNCITLERSVFTDPKVKEQLAQLVLLKADVTDYNDATRALMDAWQVYGPPALIFFNAQGQPQPEDRVDGLISPEDLSEHLEPLLRKSR
jgi:thiol:disulfide interchange protein DsbD